MKKYDLANYLNNKTAVIYTDYADGSIFNKWYVIYYHQGKMMGDSTFSDEQKAIEASILYIKDNKADGDLCENG